MTESENEVQIEHAQSVGNIVTKSSSSGASKGKPANMEVSGNEKNYKATIGLTVPEKSANEFSSAILEVGRHDLSESIGRSGGDERDRGRVLVPLQGIIGEQQMGVPRNVADKWFAQPVEMDKEDAHKSGLMICEWDVPERTRQGERTLREEGQHGVRTSRLFEEGERLCLYHVLPKFASDTDTRYCTMVQGVMVDGKRTSGPHKFINHSCSPNAELIEGDWQGVSLEVRSTRIIPPGDWVTIDYGWTSMEEDVNKLTKCLCEEAGCRGWLEQREKRAQEETGRARRRAAIWDEEME